MEKQIKIRCGNSNIELSFNVESGTRGLCEFLWNNKQNKFYLVGISGFEPSYSVSTAACQPEIVSYMNRFAMLILDSSSQSHSVLLSKCFRDVLSSLDIGYQASGCPIALVSTINGTYKIGGCGTAFDWGNSSVGDFLVPKIDVDFENKTKAQIKRKNEYNLEDAIAYIDCAKDNLECIEKLLKEIKL